MPAGRSLRVSFRTFGCKLNQAETEALADGFSAAGAVVSVPASRPTSSSSIPAP